MKIYAYILGNWVLLDNEHDMIEDDIPTKYIDHFRAGEINFDSIKVVHNNIHYVISKHDIQVENYPE